MPVSGLEVSDAKILAALRGMRARWGAAAGYANPHGGPCKPSWVESYTPKIRSGPLPPPKANRSSPPKANHDSLLPPKANHGSVLHPTRVSVLPPKSKPDAEVTPRRAAGAAAVREERRAPRPGRIVRPRVKNNAAA